MTKEILQIIDFPVWIKNKANKILFVNKSFRQEFNIDDNEECIDRKLQMRKIYKDLYNIITQSQVKSNLILTIKNNVYKQTTFSYNEDAIAGILVPVYDVLEEYNIAKESNILKTIIDNIPELIFYKDKELKYRSINEECEKFYSSRGINNVIGKNDLELPLDKEFIETCKKHDTIVLQTKKPLYIDEKVPIPDSDDYLVLKTVKTPVIDRNGEVQGLVGVVRDITNQKKLEERLRYLSYTDELTGLYNRSYFDEKISELIQNNQYPIGIITGDINGLKIVNDTLGHIEGDRLLKVISKTLLKVCDKYGFVFRWGGDEFITILPNASDSDCIKFIEEVKQLCDENKSESFKISMAQGYSLLKHGDEIDYVLRESENRAYKEKISSSKSMRKSMLDTLEKNLQLKNIETKEHTERVYTYCKVLGKKLGLDEDTIQELLLVAKFHDIGKIGISESILLKEDRLTDDEYEIMKTHSEKGYRLTLLIPELSHISRGILTHHERWDGKGYPLGIEGDEIPLIARIVSIVDAYDSMTNNRIYRNKMSSKEAIKELRKCSGTQFDPQIVKVFCNIIEKT